MEDQPASILLALQEINSRLKRIEADMESEKDTRRQRNRDIDELIRALTERVITVEKRQDKHDYFIWAVGLACIFIGGVLGWVLKLKN